MAQNASDDSAVPVKTLSVIKKAMNMSVKYALLIVALGMCVAFTLISRQVSSLNIRLNSYDAFFHSGQIARLAASVSSIDRRLSAAEQKISTLNHLSESFNETSSSLKAQQQQLDVLSSSLSQSRQELTQSGDRIQRLESMYEQASKFTADLADNLKSIMATVEKITASRKATPKVAMASADRNHPRKIYSPATASLPFALKSIELRGGRQFAVVGPRTLTAVSQLQLLSPGDEMQGWVLQSVEGTQGAVFMHNGAMRRVPLQ
ncbi:MAG TPA: hypothetical protein VGI71_18030 [Scandinavium sp.]|jgi:flagellar basal body rod protein FlgC